MRQQRLTGILLNTKTGLFHPIQFLYAPTLCEEDESDPEALVQHIAANAPLTEGFPTHEDAKSYILDAENCIYIEPFWEWDGESPLRLRMKHSTAYMRRI